MACPFGAVQVFSNEEVTENTEACFTKKLVYKCDLCIDAGEPACAANCPNKALRLVDPSAEIEEKRISAVNAMGVIASETTLKSQNQEGGE
jgi:Fe-S-cluster-containing hydrogenase component 2